MSANELRSKSTDELKKQLSSLLKEKFALSMQVATQQITNTSQIKRVRRSIARLRTILNEKGQE